MVYCVKEIELSGVGDERNEGAIWFLFFFSFIGDNRVSKIAEQLLFCNWIDRRAI